MEIAVVGGTATPKTYRYIAQLQVPMFRHFLLEIPTEISPTYLQNEATKLRWQVYQFGKVVAVGKYADTLLTLAGIKHGFLPLTKDVGAIKKCREYLSNPF